MVSVRSLPLLALAACSAARDASPLDGALSYLPTFSWISDMAGISQSPFGSPSDGLNYTDLAAFPANVLGGAASASQWSVPPRCLTAPELTEPMCVFALDSFANGRGISMVSTPSQAAAFIKMSALRKQRVPWGANVARDSIMQEREIPGAGRGMFATTQLQQGDSLYIYNPILLLHPDADKLEPTQKLGLYRHAVAALPPDTQKWFWALGTHEDDDPEVDPIDDRIDTNAFGFDLHGTNYFVISPEIARMNHDCRPNGVYHLDNVTLTQYVTAVRPIAPGEPITISYIDASLPRAARQAKLRSTWGFACACSACTQHPRLTKQSDARMREAEALVAMLSDDNDALTTPALSLDPDEAPAALEPTLTPAQAIHAAEAVVALYEQERFHSAMGEPLVHAAMAHAAAGHYDLAKLWGRRALTAAMIEDGFFYEEVDHVRVLAENPRAHWSWGIRKPVGKPAGCGCNAHGA